MGVGYRQYCMSGVSFDWSELKTVIAPAEYKLENRYDTRNGKVTYQEKILVKEEECCYTLCGRTFKYIDDIQLDGLWTEIDYENEIIYIGFPIGEPEDLGRVTLLEDSLDLLNLEKLQDRVKDMLPQYSRRVGMHLFYRVG